MPYTGDFSGALWNAQALWAAGGRKQESKFERLGQILCNRDFAGITETHGTEGKIFAGSGLKDCMSFWSHLSGRSGGIGLALKNTWLANFNPISVEDWHEIEPGRIGKLTLCGANGAIDIVVMYLQTGNDHSTDQRARISSMKKLAPHIASRAEVLTILMGDMNFVIDEQDRWTIQSKQWSGARDAPDQKAFVETLQIPSGLQEWHQEAYTCFTGLALSRLDRVYSNHHGTEQLDRTFQCGLMSKTEHSVHKPVVFSRRGPPRSSEGNKILPNHILRHDDWPKRVAAELEELQRQEDQRDNPIRTLVLMKRAMRAVTQNMLKEKCTSEAATNTDKLGCTLSFIRAAEQVRLGQMATKVREYPTIGSFVSALDPEARSKPGFQQLKDHALQLAKEEVTDELRAMNKDSHSPNDPAQRQRKEHILTKLKRLHPGELFFYRGCPRRTGQYRDISGGHRPCFGGTLGQDFQEKNSRQREARNLVAVTSRHKGNTRPMPRQTPRLANAFTTATQYCTTALTTTCTHNGDVSKTRTPTI